jgi:hypothetical protein
LGDAAGGATVSTTATWSNAAATTVRWVSLGVNLNAVVTEANVLIDKWQARYEVRQGVRAIMVPSGMTPPDRIES